MADQMVKTEVELQNAIGEGWDTIVVEGDLAKKVVKIKATGKVAWIVALGAMIVAIILALKFLLTSVGSSSFLEPPALGVSPDVMTREISAETIVLIFVVLVSVLALGIAVLNRLKSYRVEKLSDSKVKLTK